MAKVEGRNINPQRLVLRPSNLTACISHDNPVPGYAAGPEYIISENGVPCRHSVISEERIHRHNHRIEHAINIAR